MHPKLKLLALATLAFVAIPHGTASAQQDDVAFRNDLFERGKRLTREGKLDDAVKAYEALWAIEQSARVACNLGQIYFSQKEAYVKAAELLDRCQQLADTPLKPKQAAFIKEALGRVTKVELTVEPGEYNVSIDGSNQSPKPAYYLEPGMHEFVVSAPGYVEQRVLVDSAGGSTERRSVSLELRGDPPAAGPASGPKATTPPDQPPVDGTEHDPYLTRNIVVVTGGVLAVGSVALSFVFRGQANSKLDELDGLKLGAGECSGQSSTRCSQASSLSADADSAATRSDVFMGVGIGLGVATIATFLLWPDQAQSKASTRGLRIAASPKQSFIGYLGEF
ncbi:MAG: hypothetical protein AB7K71_07105 [Polyangiaceae bacterium]